MNQRPGGLLSLLQIPAYPWGSASMDRHYVSPLHNNWDEDLDALGFANNNPWHQST